MAFCPEHPKWDQNPKFTPLSETTGNPAPFVWESPWGISSLICWWFSIRKIGSTAQGENRELRLYDVALSGRSDVGQTSIFRRFRGDDFLSDTTTFSHWPDDTIKVKDRRVTVEVRN